MWLFAKIVTPTCIEGNTLKYVTRLSNQFTTIKEVALPSNLVFARPFGIKGPQAF